MLISIDQFNRTGTHLIEPSGHLDTPRVIDLTRAVLVVDAVKQRVRNEHTLIRIERENISNQGCSIRCHESGLPNRAKDGQGRNSASAA